MIISKAQFSRLSGQKADAFVRELDNFVATHYESFTLSKTPLERSDFCRDFVEKCLRFKVGRKRNIYALLNLAIANRDFFSDRAVITQLEQNTDEDVRVEALYLLLKSERAILPVFTVQTLVEQRNAERTNYLHLHRDTNY
jgi:hypothetical protein